MAEWVFRMVAWMICNLLGIRALCSIGHASYFISRVQFNDFSFLLPLALGKVCLPQTFARHVLVQHPLAFIPHKETFAVMHRYICV